MFILRDLLIPLQQEFSNTKQGRRRKVWFAYTLLTVVVPFTSSITSNLLRALQTLFGLECNQRSKNQPKTSDKNRQVKSKSKRSHPWAVRKKIAMQYCICLDLNLQPTVVTRYEYLFSA